MSSKYHYQVGVDLKTQLEKTGITQLISSLKEVERVAARALKFDTATPEIKKASAAAKELQAILNKAYDPRLGTTNLSKFRQGLIDSNKSLGYFEKTFSSVGPAGVKAFNSLTASTFATNRGLKTSNELLTKMGTTMANTVRWSVSASILQQFSGSVQQAYGYVKDLDKALNDIRIVTGKDSDEMERFAKYANQSAQTLGTSTKAFTEAALIFYQQGLGDAESKARAELTVKAAKVTGQDEAETSEQLTAVWNGYKMGAEDAAVAVDKLAAVAAASASDLEEQSKAMSKVASAASNMGVDVDQLNAMIATTVSVTRQAPESIGTAYKTIFARLGDLKVDGVDEFGVKLGDVSTQLKNMGINILDQEGNMRDMGAIVEEVGQKWGTWTKAQQAAAAQAMAGKRQYNNLVALFSNWDMYNEQLAISQNSLGTLDEQHSIYLDSVAGKTEQLRAKSERLYAALFGTEDITTFITIGEVLTDVMSNFVESIGGGSTALAGLGTLAVSIFKKQIGSAIGDSILNFQRFKLQAQQVIDQKHLLQSVSNYSTIDDLGTSKESKMLGILKEMTPYWDKMSVESRETALSLAQSTGELEEQREMLQAREQSLRNQAVAATGMTLKSFVPAQTGEINFSPAAAEQEKIARSFAKRVGSLGENTTSKQIGRLVSDLTKFDLASNKANKQIRALIASFKGGSMDVVKFQAAQKSLVEVLENNIAGGINKAKEEIESYNAKLRQIEADQAKFQQEAQLLAQREQYAQMVTNVVSATNAVGQLGFAWQGFQNLGSIWANEDLGLGEQLLQTFMNLGMTIGTTVNAYSDLMNAIGQSNTARRAELAATEASIAANVEEAAAIGAVLGVEEAETVVSGESAAVDAVQIATTEGVAAAKTQEAATTEVSTVATGADTTATWFSVGAKLSLRAAVGDVAGALAALAVIGGIVAVASGYMAQKDKQAVDAKVSLAGTSKEVADSLQEEVAAFKELAEIYKTTGDKKQELVAAAYGLTEALDVQALSISTVKDNLDEYIESLEGATKAKYADAFYDESAALRAETKGVSGNDVWIQDIVKEGPGAGHAYQKYNQNREALGVRRDRLAHERRGLQTSPERRGQLDAEIAELQKQIDGLHGDLSSKEKEAFTAIAEKLPSILTNYAKANADFITTSFAQIETTEGAQELKEQLQTELEPNLPEGYKLTDEDVRAIVASADPMANEKMQALQFFEKLEDQSVSIEAEASSQKIEQLLSKFFPEADTLEEQYKILLELGINPEDPASVDAAVDTVVDENSAKEITLKVKIEEAAQNTKELNSIASRIREGGAATEEDVSQFKSQGISITAGEDLQSLNVSAKVQKMMQKEAAQKLILAKETKNLAEQRRLESEAKALDINAGSLITEAQNREIETLKQSQEAYAEAVKTHGKTSDIARQRASELRVSLHKLAISSLEAGYAQGGFAGAVASAKSALRGFTAAQARTELNRLKKAAEEAGKEYQRLLGALSTISPALALKEMNALPADVRARYKGLQAAAEKAKKDYKAFNEAYRSAKFYTGSSGGGGGGGGDQGAQFSKLPYYDKARDRFFELNDRFEELAKSLKKLSDAQERLSGKALIDNLTKQLALLGKQKKELQNQLNLQVKIRKEIRQDLNKTVKNLGFKKTKLEYDEYGNIINYNKVLKKAIDKTRDSQKAYNDYLKKANDDKKISTAERKKLERLKKIAEANAKNTDALKEQAAAYESTQDEIDATQQEMQELAIQMAEMYTKKISVQLEVVTNFQEIQNSWLELKALIAGTDTKSNLFQIAFKTEGLQATKQKIVESKNLIDQLDKDIATVSAGGSVVDKDGNVLVGKDGLDVLKLAREEASEGLMANMKEYYDTLDAIKQAQVDWIGEVAASFEKVGAQYDYFNSRLQHQLNLTKLLYGEDSYNQMAAYYNSQEQFNLGRIGLLKDELDTSKELLDSIGSRTEENGDVWDAAYQQVQAAQTKLDEAVQSSLENLVAGYGNTIDKIISDTTKQFTSSMSIDQVAEEWERLSENASIYLDTISKSFAIDKMKLSIQQKINGMSTENQKKLNNFLAQELKLLTKKGELSQHDLDRANKRLEVEMKRIALEDAQNRKTTMQLQRDAQGNYGYVYTADREAEAKALEELSAAKDAVYQEDKKNFESSQKSFQDSYKNYMDKAKDLASRQTTMTPAEFAAEQEKLDAEYLPILNKRAAENAQAKEDYYNSTLEMYADLYGKESQEYLDLLNSGVNGPAMESVNSLWGSTMQDLIDNISGEGGFQSVATEMWADITLAGQNFADSVATVAEESGESFDSIEANISKVTDATSALAAAGDAVTNSVTNQIEAFTTAIAAVEAYKQSMTSLLNATALLADAEYKRQLVAVGGEVGVGTSLFSDDFWSSLSSFETGGYTGEWGSEGKLAMLHEKELILNQQDTKNILNSVTIASDMIQSLQASLAKMSSAQIGQLTKGIAIPGVAAQSIEQKVEVQAVFPGVTSSVEIEKALKSLNNSAAQYINKSQGL